MPDRATLVFFALLLLFGLVLSGPQLLELAFSSGCTAPAEGIETLLGGRHG